MLLVVGSEIGVSRRSPIAERFWSARVQEAIHTDDAQ